LSIVIDYLHLSAGPRHQGKRTISVITSVHAT
jgi:hypothetical protein